MSAQDVSDVLSKLRADSTLADFYQIGLWGYCDGDIKNNKATVTECSKPKSEFYFDPSSVWGIKDELSKDFNHDLNVYKTVSKWMFIAYIAAFVVTIAQIFVGFFALCSRWGSYIATLFALLAFLLTTAASVTSTAMVSLFSLSVGKKNIYTATWLAVVFSLGALIFWSFGVCCCSGRLLYSHCNNNDTRSSNAGKAPHTYEPLSADQLPAAHGGSYPMTPTNQRSNAC